MGDEESRIREALGTCALRFNGYGYLQAAADPEPGFSMSDFSGLTKPIVESRTLHADNLRNFAAFFILQRYMGKWGGEHLTKFSNEQIAYDFLFLHLYRTPASAPFAADDYVRQWEARFLPDAEEIAALVRRSFRRVGRGKRIQ